MPVRSSDTHSSKPTAVPPRDTSEHPPPGEVTRILEAAQAGDREALDQILPLVYEDLRLIARRRLARRGGSAVNATTLVHEAYLKLASRVPQATSRAHLLAIAARAMRQVLVDHARERQSIKRGGGWRNTTLTDGVWSRELDPDTLIALDDALARLDPRQRQVVECRFFGGLEETEIAEALGVTTRTVHRDWVKARAWLNRWLGDATPA